MGSSPWEEDEEAPLLAAAQGGQGQSKGQGEGSQPFQMGHKQSDSFLFKKVMGPEQGPLLGIIAQRMRREQGERRPLAAPSPPSQAGAVFFHRTAGRIRREICQKNLKKSLTHTGVLMYDTKVPVRGDAMMREIAQQ